MKNKCIIFIFILILCTRLYADSGAEFLNIGVNPRAIALGNAYSAVADDSSAVFWNPEGLNRIFDFEFFFMHQKWLFETDLEFLSAAKRFNIGVIGFSLSYFHMPDFDLFGEHGERSTASVYDLLLISSYANKFKGILYGINLKYVKRVLDDQSASAFAADAGIIYSFNLLKLYKGPFPNFDLSFLVKNVGSEVKFESEGDNLPLTFTTGFKYIIQSRIKHKLFLSGDFSYRNEEPLIFGIGIEYNLADILFLRCGYKSEDSQSQIVFGAGISYDISSFNVSVDMALFSFNEETLYPYSIGIRNSMDKSLKVSRVDSKRKVEKPVNPAYKNKTVLGFMNFKNLSNKDQLQYLSATIPESVSTILSKNTNLIIIETEKINSKIDKIRIIEEEQYNYMYLYNELGIVHLITGSFIEVENKIKVDLKIINVKNNKLIYAKSITGLSGKNIFSLIDKVSVDLSAFYK